VARDNPPDLIEGRGRTSHASGFPVYVL